LASLMTVGFDFSCEMNASRGGMFRRVTCS
jgi:hypothetical protein